MEKREEVHPKKKEVKASERDGVVKKEGRKEVGKRRGRGRREFEEFAGGAGRRGITRKRNGGRSAKSGSKVFSLRKWRRRKKRKRRRRGGCSKLGGLW